MDRGALAHIDGLLLRQPTLSACRGEIEAVADILIECFRQGGKVLLCGNGGSAADCGHIAGEMLKGFLLRRPLSQRLRVQLESTGERGTELAGHLQQGLPAIDLTAHGALATAALNDIGGEYVFAQQVIAYGKPGDVLWVLSTSGGAVNVCNALVAARALGLVTVAMTGSAGGEAVRLADRTIRVPAEETYRVQEYHLPVYHALCAAVEAALFSE